MNPLRDSRIFGRNAPGMSRMSVALDLPFTRCIPEPQIKCGQYPRRSPHRNPQLLSMHKRFGMPHITRYGDRMVSLSLRARRSSDKYRLSAPQRLWGNRIQRIVPASTWLSQVGVVDCDPVPHWPWYSLRRYIIACYRGYRQEPLSLFANV